MKINVPLPVFVMGVLIFGLLFYWLHIQSQEACAAACQPYKASQLSHGRCFCRQDNGQWNQIPWP